MKTILDAIHEGWGWKIGRPASVLLHNAFGNVIVESESGHYYRIMPEEWQCGRVAISRPELEAVRADPDFASDWAMTRIVELAQASLGELSEGQVYYLVMPGVLGGEYAESNIRKISLVELMSYSGEMARQIEGLPDGSTVEIKIKNEN